MYLYFNKEFEKEVNKILKILEKYEKEDINLRERKQHAISRQKKVSKAISTVSYQYISIYYLYYNKYILTILLIIGSSRSFGS